MKPESIKKFDYLYLGAVAIGIIAFILGYDQLLEQLRVQGAAAGIEMGSGMAIFSFIFGLGISMLLWYLVSPKGIGFVKWIIAVLFAVGLIGLPGVLSAAFSVTKILNLLSLAMQVGAIWFLFQPDATAYFKRDEKD